MTSYTASQLGERDVHDADSHLMETPQMLAEYADRDIRDRLGTFDFAGSTGGQQTVEEARRLHAAPDLLERRAPVEQGHHRPRAAAAGIPRSAAGGALCPYARVDPCATHGTSAMTRPGVSRCGLSLELQGPFAAHRSGRQAGHC